MFFHYFKYSIITMLRSRESMFWSFLFPIALSTFMFLAFGKIYETTEQLNAVPVAIVENKENDTFKTVVESISKGDDRLLEPEYMDENDALHALRDKSVNGVIYVDDNIHMTVRGEGLNESVLSSFLDQYIQKEAAFTRLAETDPQALLKAIGLLTSEVQACNELSTSDGNQDNMISFFYAVFAMSCLFAAFNGLDRIFILQANISALGARRGVAPTHKSVVIIAEFIAGHLLQFCIEILTFLYMQEVLGIDFGDRIAPILLILYIGTACGLALGMVIGALPKPSSQGIKTSITVAFTMILSIMADLCTTGLKDSIEHSAPVINRLNPAALISDAFYSLNVYDTYDRFLKNIACLGIITAVLCTVSFLLIRRTRYASI